VDISTLSRGSVVLTCQDVLRSSPSRTMGSMKNISLIGTVVAGAALGAGGCGVWTYYRPAGAAVGAVVETAPVPSTRDAADDPAIWVDPTDPKRSLILGTDKRGGLHVYDLYGGEVQSFANGRQNNVDVLSDVPFRDGTTSIAVTTATRAHTIFVYRIDSTTRRLEHLVSSTIETDLDVEGVCLVRSERTGRIYCFVNGSGLTSGEPGLVEQHELSFDAIRDRFVSEIIRRLDVGSVVEGCVADGAYDSFYVSEETCAVWRYGLEPESGDARQVVDRVGIFGRIRYNAEGITIYSLNARSGYLLVSSQGSNDFTVYDRAPPNEYRGRFHIDGRDAIDAVTHTDGIDACSVALDSRYPSGLLVVQDDDNAGENQNFKLVSFREILDQLGLH
jgi:3-phytase